MADTATKAKDTTKDNKSNKGGKDAKAAKPTPAAPVAAVGEAVENKAAPVTEVKKEKRKPKNHTDVSLNVDDPTSANTWLNAFIKQCDEHEAIAGYDQHWNNLGFIHMGPSERLGVEGCGRMVVVIFDSLARKAAGDGEDAVEAGKMLDFLMNFGKNRNAELVEAAEAAVLAAAAKIEARKGK